VFRAIAALALASAASAHPTATKPIAPKAATAQPAAAQSSAADSTETLASNAPWWERVTVTVDDDGQTQSCLYETSRRPNAAKNCSVVGATAQPASLSSETAGPKDEVTRITFERRFSPTSKPDLSALQTGDTLLSGQVMALAIDANGAVKGCKVVETSGSVASQYGCSDASAEKFDASAAGPRSGPREAYLAVRVYGHSEHVV
jgi:hypothetical protein